MLRAARVSTPGGDTWYVRTFRVRLPEWRQIDLWTEDADPRDVSSGLVTLVLLPFTLGLLPLLVFAARLPRALLAAARSDDAWVEADRYWPNSERYLWQTTRGDVPVVRAAVIEMLSAGRPTAVPRAQLVDHVEERNY